MAPPRWHTLTAGALIAATTLSACTHSSQVDPDAAVRVAIEQPGHLLPADTQDPAALQVLSTLFVPLAEPDGNGGVVPHAAEEITADQEYRVWTISLPEGRHFHDGTPVTADSYLDAWNAAAHAATAGRTSYLFARIAGYEQVNPPGGAPPVADRLAGLTKIDDHRFTVTLSEPFRDFPAMLTYPAFYPLPPAAFTPDGAFDPEFAYAPVGNGPYRLVARTDEGITLTRHAASVGSRAHNGGVEFIFYDDPVAAYERLLVGEVDVFASLPAALLSAAADDLDERYLRQPAPSFQFLSFAAGQTDLAHPDVRRAISMAIDREQLFDPARQPARAFTAPAVPGARSNTCGDACTFDPHTARQLYARAEGPAQLDLTYNLDGGHRDWAEALCHQLHEHLAVGCHTHAEPTLTDVLARVDAGEQVGLFRLGWDADYPALEGYLRPLYATDGALNWHGYSNPTFDALLTAGQQAASREEALAAFHAAEDLLAADLPIIPLSFDTRHIGHSARVQGVTGTMFGVDLAGIEVLG